MFIEGTISVKSAIENKKRKINKIYFKKDKFSKDLNYIKYLAHENKIDFQLEDIEFFNNFKKSGGVVADVEVRKFDELDFKNDLIVVVCGVEDPYNLGYIFRTGAAFGCDFIIEDKDFSLFEKTILKSSAGAYDRVKISKTNNLLDDLKKLKNKDYQINALYRSDNAKPLPFIEKKGKNVLIIGGEKRGINKNILSFCDRELFLPYTTDFKNALNASSAMAISLAFFRYTL